MIRDALLGESVLKLPPYPSATQPRCGGVGQWGCATHNVISGSLVAMAEHFMLAGEHVDVWICDIHGPEVP